jgi:hypothetical protein
MKAMMIFQAIRGSERWRYDRPYNGRRKSFAILMLIPAEAETFSFLSERMKL